MFQVGIVTLGGLTDFRQQPVGKVSFAMAAHIGVGVEDQFQPGRARFALTSDEEKLAFEHRLDQQPQRLVIRHPDLSPMQSKSLTNVPHRPRRFDVRTYAGIRQ